MAGPSQLKLGGMVEGMCENVLAKKNQIHSQSAVGPARTGVPAATAAATTPSTEAAAASRAPGASTGAAEGAAQTSNNRDD